ncbi:uncharacterized protein LOC121050032 [Rosa chinensis]|uniref:uncharacterized protein LOC121050032 n=1 Tax=Rosa chinensis TaxID=74649 RepID=UPI001AD8B6F0|nr:uncharacterized protein LOC121050032 [Rosa chinensis]
MHVFKNCSVIACCWLYSPLGLRAHNLDANNMKDWILGVIEKLSKQQVGVFFMQLWAIWTERNKLAWNGGEFNPMHAVTWPLKLLHDYQSCHPLKAHNKRGKGNVAKWEFPPRGRLKVNVDGAFMSDTGSGGVGVIVRDDYGHFKAAWSRFWPHLCSAFHSEVEACRAGLLLAIHQGWKQIELESDLSLLLAALNNPVDDNNSEVSRILDDCRDYMQEFDVIRIRHVSREANSAADRIAHFAVRSYY